MPTPVIVQENASYAGTSDLLGFLGVGTSLGTSGPTGEDYDAFMSMGGGGDGSSFSEWYSEGGRAGMTLDDWIAAKGVIYVGADVQSLFTNLSPDMHFSLVNFSGDTRVVTSTTPLAVQDFSTTACGGFKYTGKGQASIAGEGVVVQSAWMAQGKAENDRYHSELDFSVSVGGQVGGWGFFSGAMHSHELAGVHMHQKGYLYYSGKKNEHHQKHFFSAFGLSIKQNMNIPLNSSQPIDYVNEIELSLLGITRRIEFDENWNYQNYYVGVGMSTGVYGFLGIDINLFLGLKF